MTPRRRMDRPDMIRIKGVPVFPERIVLN